MAAVTDAEAKALNTTAHDLRMDVLVEVHDERELERALELETRLIGFNNRNLHRLQGVAGDERKTGRPRAQGQDSRVRRAALRRMKTVCDSKSRTSYTFPCRRKPDAQARCGGRDARAAARRSGSRAGVNGRADPYRPKGRSAYGRCVGKADSQRAATAAGSVVMDAGDAYDSRWRATPKKATCLASPASPESWPPRKLMN